MPARQRQYEADKEATLRENGLNYPPGTPTRDLFEKRLANREPTATFALTNSLAAVLAPWLVVGLGIVAATWHDRRPRITWLICLVPIAVCLLLTKSRSGYAAAALGIIWLAFGVRGPTMGVPPAFHYGQPQTNTTPARFEKRWRPCKHVPSPHSKRWPEQQH